MSSKPRYYYNLTIYDPKVDHCKTEKDSVSLKPPGWYFPIGIGKHVVSLLETTKTAGTSLTAKGSDLLQYASSLEGTVKLGFIASCTCAGGIASLLIRPNGRIRKLFYPSLFLAGSSAICYPSNAYVVAKTGIVYAYNGGESVYNIAKLGQEKMSEWRSVRKAQQQQPRLPQQPLPEEVTDATLGHNLQEDDIALKNPPNLFNEDAEKSLQKLDDQDKAVGGIDNLSMNTVIPKQNSVQDIGQSSAEDKDLYTTRV